MRSRLAERAIRSWRRDVTVTRLLRIRPDAFQTLIICLWANHDCIPKFILKLHRAEFVSLPPVARSGKIEKKLRFFKDYCGVLWFIGGVFFFSVWLVCGYVLKTACNIFREQGSRFPHRGWFSWWDVIRRVQDGDAGDDSRVRACRGRKMIVLTFAGG